MRLCVGWFVVRWVLAAGKSEFGVCGVVGGKMVIELLAGTMRLVRDGIAAAGCSSMGRTAWEEKTAVAIYCGNQV